MEYMESNKKTIIFDVSTSVFFKQCYIHIYIYIAIWLSFGAMSFQILRTFRTSVNINILTEKDVFVMDFPFFKMDYLKTPPP